jgi:phage terminase large subunit-like protein
MSSALAHKYIADVLSGDVVAGKSMKDACTRFLTMKEDKRFEYKAEVVDRVCSFFSHLKHFSDQHYGKPFELEPWQAFIVAGIYGLHHAGTQSRVVRRAYVEVARKNGKSALVGGLALYHLVGDGVHGAEVYLSANSKEQAASSVWKFCKTYASILNEGCGELKIYRDSIQFPYMLSRLRMVAADSSKLDGLNPSMWVIDEYHAAKNTQMREVFESGQGTRESPLGIIITTAGDSLLSPCYQEHTNALDILSGNVQRDSTFAAIFTLDDSTEEWKEKDNWIKSNPNLGVSLNAQFLENAVLSAKEFVSEEVGIKTKNFNVWCSSSSVWIKDEIIREVSKSRYTLEDLRELGGETPTIFAGIDLSSTTDIASLAFVLPVPSKRKLFFKVFYYLPESALKANRFRKLYGAWANTGAITITPGNVTDYDFVLNDLERIREAGLYIAQCGYDKWNSSQFVINCQQHGFFMTPYSQTVGSLNRPTKELERAILSKYAEFDNNEITRHCFRNVELVSDAFGNVRPSKKNPEKKIDGVAASLNAYGMYLENSGYSDIFIR